MKTFDNLFSGCCIFQIVSRRISPFNIFLNGKEVGVQKEKSLPRMNELGVEVVAHTVQDKGRRKGSKIP